MDITKGIVLNIQSERSTTRQRVESDHFRFGVSYEQRRVQSLRLAPAEAEAIGVGGYVRLLVLRAGAVKLPSGELASGSLGVEIVKQDTSVVNIDAAPLLILTGVEIDTFTITNTDPEGTPAKDVTVEYYL